MATINTDSNTSAGSSNSRSNNRQEAEPKTCYLRWMDQQWQDLQDLMKVYYDHPDDHEKHLHVNQTIMNHFKEYQRKRTELAMRDPHSMFSASWCSSLENSYFWIAGCRATLGIRLVYALCGSEAEAQLTQFLQGEHIGNLGDLSADQLHQISDLQAKTVKVEDVLSSRLASMQEDIGDDPLAVIAHKSNIVGETTEEVDRAIHEHAVALANILKEADELRVNTLMELMKILDAKQTVDLLLATKKLRLSFHEWGKERDRRSGRT